MSQTAFKRPKQDIGPRVCKCDRAMPDRHTGSCIRCGRWLSPREAATQS